MELKLGMEYKLTDTVTNEYTARHVGSGRAEVLATPKLIALMENAAMLAVQDALEEGTSTVGTYIEVSHVAATPVSMQITVSAVLTEIDNRRLTFLLEAFDEKEKIGFGKHVRAIVHEEKFAKKMEAKVHGH